MLDVIGYYRITIEMTSFWFLFIYNFSNFFFLKKNAISDYYDY